MRFIVWFIRSIPFFALWAYLKRDQWPAIIAEWQRRGTADMLLQFAVLGAIGWLVWLWIRPSWRQSELATLIGAKPRRNPWRAELRQNVGPDRTGDSAKPLPDSRR